MRGVQGWVPKRYKTYEAPVQRFIDWPGKGETSWELMLKSKGWGEWEGQEELIDRQPSVARWL